MKICGAFKSFWCCGPLFVASMAAQKLQQKFPKKFQVIWVGLWVKYFWFAPSRFAFLEQWHSQFRNKNDHAQTRINPSSSGIAYFLRKSSH